MSESKIFPNQNFGKEQKAKKKYQKFTGKF